MVLLKSGLQHFNRYRSPNHQLQRTHAAELGVRQLSVKQEGRKK